MNIHFIMQNRGGIGKTLVAAILAQHCAEQGKTICIDADKYHKALTRFKGLGVQQADLTDTDYCALVDQVLNAPEDTTNIIIDTTADQFSSLLKRIKEDNLDEIATASGHILNLHTVMAGGSFLIDTLNGANQLSCIENARIIVWENHFYSEYLNKAHRIKNATYLTMRHQASNLFAIAVVKMTMKRQTFEEAIHNPKFNVLERSRLFRIRSEYREMLTDANIGIKLN